MGERLWKLLIELIQKEKDSYGAGLAAKLGSGTLVDVGVQTRYVYRDQEEL